MKMRFCIPVLLFVLIGCKEDDPKPTAAEKQGELLGGKKGASKTWILTDYEIDNITIDAFECFDENEYTFFNNEAQEFEGDEGSVRCTDADTGQPLSQSIESGRWAFTTDGKIVIISSDVIDSPVAIFSTFSAFGNPFPAEVTTLSATDLVIVAEYSAPGFSETVRLTFEAK
jgi:hypothetical protein